MNKCHPTEYVTTEVFYLFFFCGNFVVVQRKKDSS